MCQWNISNMEKFKHIQQQKENSCWVACAAMIINCVCKTTYQDEDEFKKAHKIAKNTGDKQGNPMGLINQVLKKTKDFKCMVSDDHPLPTAQEIKDHFKDCGTPLLCCVGTDKPTKEDNYGKIMPNNEYSGGHWILIIGIQEDNNNYNLIVADPADGEPTPVLMDDITYQSDDNFTLYWENTSYVNFKPC